MKKDTSGNNTKEQKFRIPTARHALVREYAEATNSSIAGMWRAILDYWLVENKEDILATLAEHRADKAHDNPEQ